MTDHDLTPSPDRSNSKPSQVAFLKVVAKIADTVSAKTAGTSFAFSIGAVALAVALLSVPPPRYVLQATAEGAGTATDPTSVAVVEHDILSWISDELTKRELAGFLDVAASDESITITGVIPESRWGTWIDFRRIYDQQSGARPLITDTLFEKDLPKLPPVALVRFSEPQEILFGDGSRGGQGTILANGWTIEAIHPDGLTVKRADRRLKIEFGS